MSLPAWGGGTGADRAKGSAGEIGQHGTAVLPQKRYSLSDKAAAAEDIGLRKQNR